MDPQTIAIWKIVVDVALMGTLILVAAKFLRSPARDITRLAELDASIRLLLKEAEAGSRGLADQLVRRQESLERLLMDIGGSEQRIQRAISQADELKGSLSALIQASHSIPANNAVSNVASVSTAVQVQRVSTPPVAPSFEDALIMEPQTSPSVSRVEQVRRTRLENNQRLASKVEKVSTSSEKSISEIKQVYEAAEKMLIAGDDLRSVAAVTKLSMEQIGRLKDSLSLKESSSNLKGAPVEIIKDYEEENTVKDPRLGALGTPVRRQTQIL